MNPMLLWLERGVCVVLALLAIAFCMLTVHWPIVNDAIQLHYVCFMMDHGFVPYRQLIEVNLPGIYLVNWSVMHALGGGSLAWRFFDFLVLAFASAAMVAIAWPYDRWAGLFAASLLVLFHGRDGMAQSGQRDLIIAALFLAAYALAFHALRQQALERKVLWPMSLFGLCMGFASTIKPTPLPFAVAVLCIVGATLWRRNQPMVAPIACALGAMLLPFVAMAAYLLNHHALRAFLHLVATVFPYYATLGRESLRTLVVTSVAPSLRLVVALTALLIVMRRDWRQWESIALMVGLLFGLASFVGQGKGFPYHRYPLLAFLLLAAALQFTAALRDSRVLVRAAGIAGLVFGLTVGAMCLQRALQYRQSGDYANALSADLNRLGGASLSGGVQCLGWTWHCDATLFRMQLVQATGLFYDYLLFGPQQAPTIQETRTRFWQMLERNPPRVFVVSTGNFLDRPLGYARLQGWPQFDDYLHTHYALCQQRAFSKPGVADPEGYRIDQEGYRIYVREPAPELWTRTTCDAAEPRR
ncbi:MAG: hypothetical protein ACR2JE_17030 [Acidobacteriaceae bacterium]